MRHLALRAGLLSALTVGMFAGSGFAYFEFPYTTQAKAQEQPVVPVASPTENGMAEPTATLVPTPTATPVPSSRGTTATDPATSTATATTINTATASATETGTANASATPTVVPTATPVPEANLPVLAAQPDAPGTAIQTTIDALGGKVASPDGRVSVDVPAGVFQEPMKIIVTRRDHTLLSSPGPDFPLAAVWQFDAVTADAAATPVHRFSANVTISVHLSAIDLDGRNPATLVFWTFDDALQQWLRVPGAVDAQTRVLTVGINHFSTDGATADLIKDLAPLLDGHNVGLHSGTANLSIPIDVPPGRGGLTPQLALSYDSGRADEMRHYTSLASWAGLGWDLGTGSVTISASATTGNARAFLNASAFGGEMMPDGTTDAGKFVWHLRDEVYIRIRTNCGVLGPVLCTLWVTDKEGRVYTYGGDLAHARYSMMLYSGYGGNAWGPDFYQFDLASITDLLGNRIDYTYTQYMSMDPTCTTSSYPKPPTGCTYVLSAYPATVSYNYNTATPPVAQTQIQFNTGCDGTPGVNFYPGTGPAICMRDDTPRNFAAAGSCDAYTAPLVMETQRLNSIDVRQGGQLARHYDLAHTTTPFYRTVGGTVSVPPCSPYVGYVYCVYDQYNHCSLTPSATDQGQGFDGGTDVLTGLSIKGSDGTSNLLSMVFQSAPKHVTNTLGPWDYNWPHLTQADNGIGGHDLFAYTEKTSGTGWSREAVTQETKQAGMGEPDMVTTYAYASGPVFQEYPDPYNQPYYVGYGPRGGYSSDLFNALYRGFGQVTETDAAGNPTVHSYYTTGYYCCTPSFPYSTTPSDWVNEILTGREYQTQWKDSSNNIWKTMTSTFVSVALPNSYTVPPQSQGQSFINFIYPLQVATTLKDESQTYGQNQFDSVGNPTLSNDFVGTAPTNPTQLSTCSAATGCMLSTSTAYASDTTDWIFRPRYVAKADPQHSNALLSCSRSYYDGAKSAGTLVAGSAKGLPTAESAAISATTCDATTAFTTSTNGYSVFDSYGNAVQSSVPTAAPPEGQTNGGTFGWIPSGVASGTKTFDSTYRTFVMQEASPTVNGLTQTTNYNVGGNTFDFRYGKPTKVTLPNGNTVNYQYDVFGRVTAYWDSLDSATYPTSKFSYTWGALPNQTLVKQIVAHGSTTYRNVLSCMDGFGREYEHREQYLSFFLNSVRTDYDTRGMKSVVTNPVYTGVSTTCPTSPVAALGRDRTAYAYNPLGNATTTTSLAANQTTGPYTTATNSGLTSSVTDELNHTTTTAWNPATLTQTVTDAYSNATIYRKDPLGRLTTVTDVAGNVTTLGYDMGGRKISMHDPDMGSWTYGYDVAGNLTSQVDARAITTTLTYDALKRLTGKTYSNGDPAVTLTYDAYTSGDLTACAANTGFTVSPGLATTTVGSGSSQVKTLNCPDIRGNPLMSRTVIDTNNYDVKRTFDAYNQPSAVTYPDGEIVQYTLSSKGSDVIGLSSTTYSQTFLSVAQRTPWLAVSSLPLGNTLTTNYGYDYRERVTSIQTSTVQNLALSYDNASNVSTVTDSTTSETATYGYDNLNRLTSMLINGSTAATYGYNAIGNVISKTESYTGMLNPTNMTTMSYPASGASSVHPHALTSTVGTPALTLTYDANGNLATQGSSTYGFDAENRLKTRSVTGGTVTNVYDATGTLVKRINADGSWTVYVGGILEKTFASGGSVTGYTKYYAALGRTIAIRATGSGGGAGTLSYVLADHLGSPVATADANGTVTSTQKYWPYGATRTVSGTMPTDKLYTGQQVEPGDSALGLYNYKARFYSTVLGRFLSVDPVGGNAADAQSWNAYTYVGNNPLAHVDPTGMCDPDDPGCHFFKPALGEDRSGESQLTPGMHDFLNSATCDNCYALELLARSGASPQNLIAAARSSNAADYLRQVYEYTGHGGLPGPVDVAIDFVPYVGDGRALADFDVSPAYAVTVVLFVSPIPGDRAGAKGLRRALHSDGIALKAGSAGGPSSGKAFSQSVRNKVLAENADICVYCRMRTDSPQVDHVIPRSRGGNATVDNAQTACLWCNTSKGAGDYPINPPPTYEGPWPPSWWLR